mmetsp:Transcript_81089/g.158422  ORF Transcript_81089/g.158422 Transcript_81089/m.158422 type:complete len:392 (+) Transcript_81089:558-1733(+)
MGPHCRLLGPFVPPPQIRQDPVPSPLPPLGSTALSASELAGLKEACLAAQGVSAASLVRAAWASASTCELGPVDHRKTIERSVLTSLTSHSFVVVVIIVATDRCTDHRGGANGGRVRLSPQKDWAANDPEELTRVLAALEQVRSSFVSQMQLQSGDEAQAFGHSGVQTSLSMADLLVVAGGAAVEAAAEAAGHTGVQVPFADGRTDATDEATDGESFAVLEPRADGFRNFESPSGSAGAAAGLATAEAMLVDKAQMLTLSKAELAVLVGGMRAIGATHKNSAVGVLTTTPGALDNSFFVNLLDLGTEWAPLAGQPLDTLFEGKDRATGAVKWTASRVDLIFGSNAELRAVAEHYACSDAGPAFVNDFVAAWAKVMNLDRFDLEAGAPSSSS